MDSTMYSECNQLTRSNFVKFRCRLDSTIGNDVHRDFVGVFYPRWRAMYVHESREVLGEIKLCVQFPFDVYLKKDNEFYFTDDFFVGAKISLGKTLSQRDKGEKAFIITDVDASRLRCFTETIRKRLVEKKFPEKAVADLISVREAFVHAAGGSLERGIKDIGRRFRTTDDCGDRKINKLEFTKALHEVHLQMTVAQVGELFSAFDSHEDGIVSFNELLEIIRGPMSDIRKRVVAEAFRKIDANRRGILTLHDLLLKYNFLGDPEVASGRMTEPQARNVFVAAWDTREDNGIVSYAEFCDYYSGISASIESDEEFVGLVCRSWKL